MANTFKQIMDFLIKIIMVFTTIVALVFFAKQYPNESLVFGAITLVYVLAIIIKGLMDIFRKD